jgi:hypothetical protein
LKILIAALALVLVVQIFTAFLKFVHNRKMDETVSSRIDCAFAGRFGINKDADGRDGLCWSNLSGR